jgi:DNA-binding transcriptional LysR family regulator
VRSLTRPDIGLELRHLRCFVAVAEHGQVSTAAEALRLAQPAVSQTIRQLERELGVDLFRRHPRGVALTRAGEELLPKARVALTCSQEAFDTARAHAREQHRQLIVGFLPPLTDIATEILAAYERAQPIIKLEIKQISFGDHMQAVRTRRVDVAFVWAAFEKPDVVLETMTEEPRVVCMSASHPLAGQRQLRFEQIEDEPVPGVAAGVPAEIADFLHLADRRRRPVRQAELAPRSIDETIWLLTSGRAICLGPASLAQVFARPGIVNIPLIDVEPVKIAVAHHADDHRAAVGAFVRLARDHFRATHPAKHPADAPASAAASS